MSDEGSGTFPLEKTDVDSEDLIVVRVILYKAFLPPITNFNLKIDNHEAVEEEWRKDTVNKDKQAPSPSVMIDELKRKSKMFDPMGKTELRPELLSIGKGDANLDTYEREQEQLDEFTTKLGIADDPDETPKFATTKLSQEMRFGLLHFTHEHRFDIPLSKKECQKILDNKNLYLRLNFNIPPQADENDKKKKKGDGDEQGADTKIREKFFTAYFDLANEEGLLTLLKKKVDPHAVEEESEAVSNNDSEEEDGEDSDEGAKTEKIPLGVTKKQPRKAPLGLMYFPLRHEVNDPKPKKKDQGKADLAKRVMADRFINGEVQILSAQEVREHPLNNNDNPVTSQRNKEINDPSIYETMFKYFGVYSSAVEDFVFETCKVRKFDTALDNAISASDDPLRTALKASIYCEDRGSQSKTAEGIWEAKQLDCIKTAMKLAEFLDQNPDRPIRSKEESQVREYIINTNIDFAIENKIEPMCEHPVFLARITNRWQKNLEHFRARRCCSFYYWEWPWISSPFLSCILQLISYVLFLLLLLHATNPNFEIVHVRWSSQMSDSIFGEDGADPDKNPWLFAEIGDANSFYVWLNHVVDTVASPDDGGQPVDSHFTLATDMTIRQLRVVPDDKYCKLLWKYEKYNTSTCFRHLDDDHTRLQTTPWWNGTSDTISAGTMYMPPRGFDTLRGQSGRPVVYQDGGYFMYLSQQASADKLKANVTLLNQSGWIDGGTRAVIVEFALYSFPSNSFLLVQSLVEFTHVGTVHTTKGLSLLSAKDTGETFDWAKVMLLIFLISYLVQEGSEFFFEWRFQFARLDYNRQVLVEKQRSMVSRLTSEELMPPSRRWKSFTTTFEEHWTDVWNLLDFANSICLLLFLSLKLAATNRIPADVTQSDMESLMNVEWYTGWAYFFASWALILSWFRLLYFSMFIRNIGLLVIAVIRMMRDIFNFFMLLIVIAIGFGGAFNVLYNGVLIPFTGNLWDIMVNSLLISLDKFDDDLSDPPFVGSGSRGLGRFLLVLYFFVSTVLLINMLIAMMGNTFNELMEPENIGKKWALFNGSLLHHYERFNWLPPPLNLLDMPLRALDYIFYFCCWNPPAKPKKRSVNEEEDDMPFLCQTSSHISSPFCCRFGEGEIDTFKGGDMNILALLNLPIPQRPGPSNPTWREPWSRVTDDLKEHWAKLAKRQEKKERERKKRGIDSDSSSESSGDEEEDRQGYEDDDEGADHSKYGSKTVGKDIGVDVEEEPFRRMPKSRKSMQFGPIPQDPSGNQQSESEESEVSQKSESTEEEVESKDIVLPDPEDEEEGEKEAKEEGKKSYDKSEEKSIEMPPEEDDEEGDKEEKKGGEKSDDKSMEMPPDEEGSDMEMPPDEDE